MIDQTYTNGKRVRLLRLVHGYTRDHLGGDTRSTSSTSSGKSDWIAPSEEGITELLLALGCNPSYLQKGIPQTRVTPLRLRLESADSLLLDGQISQALGILRNALTDPALVLLPVLYDRTAFGFARGLEADGRYRQALSHLDRLVTRLPSSDPLWAHAHAARSRCHRLDGDAPAALAIANEALRRMFATEATGGDAVLAIEQLAAYTALGEHERALRLSRNLLRRLDIEGDPTVRSRGYRAAAYAAAAFGDGDSVRTLTRRALAIESPHSLVPATFIDGPTASTRRTLAGAGNRIIDPPGQEPTRRHASGDAAGELMLQVRGLIDAGEVEKARASARRLMGSLAGASPGVEGRDLALAGEAFASAGDHVPAFTALKRAAGCLTRAELYSEAALAWWRVSCSLVALGNREVARSTMMAAFAIAHRERRSPAPYAEPNRSPSSALRSRFRAR
ncbi:hypothetical protein GCM10029978_066330 [Actinoallomurus acanthiterrae]